MGVVETAEQAANSVANGITYAVDQYWNNEAFTNGTYNISPAGVLVLVVHALLTLAYLLWVWIRKTWNRWYVLLRDIHHLGVCMSINLLHRKKMDAVAAGMFRLAAARGEVGKLELLKRVHAFDINADVEGWTALHAAAAMAQPEAIAWLLANGADPHRQKDDSWRDTVLHYAAAGGSLDCVKILLAFGSDPRAKNFAGLIPRDYAASNNHLHVVEHLDMVVRALGDANGLTPPGINKIATIPPNQLRASDVFYNAEASKQQPRRSSTSGGPIMSTSKAALRRKLRALCRRGWEGIGTPGTKRTRGNIGFRVLGVLSALLGALYLVWRACRSLTGGWLYFYSIPLFTVEWLGWLGWLNCVLGLWSTIDRMPRMLHEVLPEDKFPTVDVFIVCYNEPANVIEPTTIAALNLNYPADKLTVYVLDDGKREEIRNMALKLDFQLQFKKKSAKLCYISREKVHGVPHHAKAGNINHALLKGGVFRGEYVLVLDCDMLVHPDFLVRTVGHLYGQDQGQWVQKEKLGFLQTPQDFWNVDATDPMFHLNSFFYGPMLKGRDGLGATPCAGTGVIFKRDVLVSIGGQSYGSITEDFNTAMHLLMSGFGTMYLDDHLTYGMAPDDVPSTFTQRLRWAMGAVQIYIRNNPLVIPGLTHAQAMLFYDSCASHFLAIGMVFVSLIPIVYMFSGVSPIVIMEGQVWEFVAAFLAFYLSNRVTLLWAFLDSHTGMHALWRTSQQAVWISPNHCKAVWQVLRTELPILRWMARFEIGFAVTRKDKQAVSKWRQFRDTLSCVWPFLLFFAAGIAGITFVIVYICLGRLDLRQGLGNAAAALWTVLTMLLIWPPIATLLPRVYTSSGWKVVWRLPNPAENTVGVAGTVGPALSRVPTIAMAASAPPAAYGSGGAADGPLEQGVSQLSGRLPSIRTHASLDSPPLARHGTAGGMLPPGAVAVPIAREPSARIAAEEQDVGMNFGRVGVGLTREELSQMPSMVLTAPPRLAPAELQEISALFHRLARHVGETPPSADMPVEGPLQGTPEGGPLQAHGTVGSQTSHGPLRYPGVPHAEPVLSLGLSKGGLSRHPTGGLSRHPTGGLSRHPTGELASIPTVGRTLVSIGSLQLRLRTTAPTVDAVHNAAMAAEEVSSVELPLEPADSYLLQNNPAVLQAVATVAEQEAMPALKLVPTQQWVSNTADGEQFITFGNGKRVGIPLLVEALDFALANGVGEDEQIQLFGQYLFSGNPAEAMAADAATQPVDPVEAAAAIAAAAQPVVSVADAPEGLADNSILAQPDFSMRRSPPANYAFLLVFGVLVVGLAVAGILDAVNVLS